MQHRTTVTAGDGMDFVISDGSLDRHGTRINPKGWDLANFQRNPIALFGHSDSFPVGRWENVRVEKDRLIGRLVLAAEGTSDRIDELRKLVEQGILRAVSVGFSVLQWATPGKSNFDIERQELHEASLVAVGSNTNALAKARSLNISESTLRLAFGEQAEPGRTAVSPGENATRTSPNGSQRSMKTLTQRIEDAQNELNSKRDRLTELTSADSIDGAAVDALNGQIEDTTRDLARLKRSEAALAGTATPNGQQARAGDTQQRRPLGVQQREVSGMDLLVRSIVVRGISHFAKQPIDAVLEQRYPGHEPTAVMTRADQTLGTTTVSGWASELVQTAYGDFMQALTGYSIYPALRDKGIGLSFDGVGTVTVPGRTAGGAGGGFVAEGAPIRVGRITTASVSLTPRKMGVIIPFSRELAKRSTPAIEALVRQAILEDTSAVLDPILLDATAGDTARPAGLLNGISAASVGYGGGDYVAVINDFKTLLAPFIAANAADNITVIMNPTQGLALSMMPGPSGQPNWFAPIKERISIVESTHATAGRLIAIRNSDFVTANGDAPEFDVSEQATIHMEDTTPLEIVSGTGPATADPVRSLWQTGSIGVRMLMDLAWKMRRSGVVQWINGTSW